MAENAEAGPSKVREIRITNHGKMKNWVAAALEHLQTHEDEPLVLHTLPATPGQPVTAGEQAENGERAAGEDQSSGEKKAKGLHPTMATIPRLVSVVEIIKREYLKTLDASLAEAGTLSGLHQYNEVGELQDAGRTGTGNEEEERAETLARALRGRNHLQQKKIAFMRVTLSRKALPGLVGTGVTYQGVSVRRLSKSARARLKHKKPRPKAKGHGQAKGNAVGGLMTD